MITVGVHNSGVTSSCAIMKSGELLFAASEERFSRIKYDKLFPIKSLSKGLDYLGLNINQISNFGIAWNPSINLAQKYRSAFSDWPPFAGARLYSTPNKILPMLDQDEFTQTVLSINKRKKNLEFFYVNHHDSHAALSFLGSGFDNADILINDGYGEESCFTVYNASKNGIEKLYSQEFPHSVGMLYSTITQFLGFRPNFDEWKVMGASAYGNYKINLKKFEKLISFDQGKIYLNLKYFNFFNFEQSLYYSSDLIELLGMPRKEHVILDKYHYDLAATLQYITEIMVLKQLHYLKNKTQSKNLCLSGGVAMNCLLNGKISSNKIYDKVCIPHSPDDSGNAIGAALLVQSNKFKSKFKHENIKNPFLGILYDSKYCEDVLNKYKIKFVLSDNIYKHASELIADGNIVGWFNGRMEFGQRALGNRSILADPRLNDIKEKINKAVKFRENFRPFAPSVLDEEVSNWFETDDNQYSIFMEKISFVKKNKQKYVPGIVHYDGSARLQTVTKNNNYNFYMLISEFYKISKVPMLINTSFNINSEPIVESPSDAIRTFFTSGLDYLILENLIVSKI